MIADWNKCDCGKEGSWHSFDERETLRMFMCDMCFKEHIKYSKGGLTEKSVKYTLIKELPCAKIYQTKGKLNG